MNPTVMAFAVGFIHPLGRLKLSEFFLSLSALAINPDDSKNPNTKMF